MLTHFLLIGPMVMPTLINLSISTSLLLEGSTTLNSSAYSAQPLSSRVHSVMISTILFSTISTEWNNLLAFSLLLLCSHYHWRLPWSFSLIVTLSQLHRCVPSLLPSHFSSANGLILPFISTELFVPHSVTSTYFQSLTVFMNASTLGFAF